MRATKNGSNIINKLINWDIVNSTSHLLCQKVFRMLLVRFVLNISHFCNLSLYFGCKSAEFFWFFFISDSQVRWRNVNIFLGMMLCHRIQRTGCFGICPLWEKQQSSRTYIPICSSQFVGNVLNTLLCRNKDSQKTSLDLEKVIFSTFVNFKRIFFFFMLHFFLAASLKVH